MTEEKKKPHPLQRAWAAGVFEARNVWPKNGYLLRIDSTNETMVRRFHETVGVGTLGQNQRKHMAHPIYIWRVTNMDDTREVLKLMVPFLSGNKLKLAADMIARIERNPIWQKQNPEKHEEAIIKSQATS